MGVGIYLAGQRITLGGIAGVLVPDRTIWIGEVSAVRDDLQVGARDEIPGDDLRYAAFVTAGLRVPQPGDNRHPGGAVVFTDLVVGLAVAESHRGQIAEHVLTQGKTRGVGNVVPFHTVDIRRGVGGFIVQIFDRAGFLLAFVLDDAGLTQHIDGGAADLVDEIVALDGEVLGELLAHQHGFAGDVHPAAAVLAVEEIGAVIGQHIRARAADHEQRSDYCRTSEDALPLPHTSIAAAAAAGAAGGAARSLPGFTNVIQIGAGDGVAVPGHDGIRQAVALIRFHPGLNVAARA